MEALALRLGTSDVSITVKFFILFGSEAADVTIKKKDHSCAKLQPSSNYFRVSFSALFNSLCVHVFMCFQTSSRVWDGDIKRSANLCYWQPGRAAESPGSHTEGKLGCVCVCVGVCVRLTISVRTSLSFQTLKKKWGHVVWCSPSDIWKFRSGFWLNTDVNRNLIYEYNLSSCFQVILPGGVSYAEVGGATAVSKVCVVEVGENSSHSDAWLLLWEDGISVHPIHRNTQPLRIELSTLSSHGNLLELINCVKFCFSLISQGNLTFVWKE